MILSNVVLACDVPTCAARLQRESSESQAHAIARIRQAAVLAGWWVDAMGRAWCPTHRAPDQRRERNVSVDLASQLLKVIAGHDWGWLENSRDGNVDGLECDCGWVTSATDNAVDRWKKHRSRAVRAAIDELTGPDQHDGRSET